MAVIIAVCALYLAAAAAFFHLALIRGGANKMGRRSPDDKFWGGHYDEISAGVSWFYAQKPEQVEILSHDGLRLCGYFLPAENARATLILMHGYRSAELFDFSCIYEHLHNRGFNLLVPWQRAHGKSEGKLICFGVKERIDCSRWAEYISERLGKKLPIILEGMSMGATTVLMAAGLDLPENVAGIVADCGFTTPYEVIEHTMRRWHIPPHPYLDLMLPAATAFGIDLKMSTADALRRCRRPVLLIHGDRDDIVPPEMSRRNRDACAGECRLLEVHGAGHAFSYIVATDECNAALDAFFKKILKTESVGND